MANWKNQHFVPRCALKPFSLGTEGRAINTYVVEAARPVENVPLRTQCSRDYFYGKDLQVEKALGDLEGHYARILSDLIDRKTLGATDEDWLRLFSVIQSRRTERAITEIASVQEDFMKAAFKKSPDERPPVLTHQQLVTISMRAGLAMHERARS
jgi:Protein of unknown function (DUF4238)